MLDELQTWWQNTTPQTQAALQAVGVMVTALLGGHVLGGLVARALRARNFDAALRLPGSSPARLEADHGITPTLIAGLLVRLTVWAGAGWWLAREYGRVELASTLGLVINRTWALATVLLAALALGSMLARRLIDCLHGVGRPGPEAGPSRHGTTAPRSDLAAVVGAVAYVLAVLLVLLIAADLFDWPLTRSAGLALWQFAQHLLVAGAALYIGALGAGWARDLVTPEAASPEKRAGQYTAVGVMAATTVLAVAVLLSSAGVLLGLAALAVLGLLLWLARGYLPDVAAGLQLRVHQIREVWLDGEAWQVTEVGFLTTQVCRAGAFGRLANRRVLEARLHTTAQVAATPD